MLLDQIPAFFVCRFFNVCVRVLCAPNATILLIYISAKIKISFIWRDDLFFFAKIGIFCKSITGPLPSIVQAYTQSYSFGRRIKLIIFQIRHELSITMHEISTSWKKNVRWRILYFANLPFNHRSYKSKNKNSRVTVLVVKLHRNGSTNFHEILCAYRVGLKIGKDLFCISLKVKRVWQIVEIEYLGTYWS